MCSYYSQSTDDGWLPLSLPETLSQSGGWILIKTTLTCQGERGSTWLRWFDENGQSHKVILPVARSGKLIELVHLPKGIQAIMWQPTDKGAKYYCEPIEISKVGILSSIFRRLRRVLPVCNRYSRRELNRLGLTFFMPFSDLQKAYQIVGKLRDARPLNGYLAWLAQFEAMSTEDKITRQIKKWARKPYFHLYIIGDASTSQYEQTLASISNQYYPQDHIIISVKKYIDQSTAQFTKKFQAEENTWLWVIPAGARLSETALYWFAQAIQCAPKINFFYGDHDLLSSDGERYSPHFKPDWNPALLLTHNYIGWSAITRINNSDMLEDASSVYRRWLQISLCLSRREILHIPSIVLHVPAIKNNFENVTVVKNFMSSVHPEVKITSTNFNTCRIHWPLPDKLPLVSIIIPTRNGLQHLRPCVESILSKTKYSAFEIIIMDNQSDETATLNYLNNLNNHNKIKVLPYAYPFNYSAINNEAVKHAQGEIVCLLNNDTEVIEEDWLNEMVSQLLRPGVGVVGAKLLYSDGSVQHGGVAVGPGGCADHLHHRLASEEPGYCLRAQCVQELSAVTAACLLTHKSLFEKLGGLDAQHLPVAFNDVDYCLRVQEEGCTIIWSPHAVLYHHESVSRGKDVSPQQKARAQSELNYMRSRWREKLQHDPYYNPNLSYDRPDFSLSRLPRVPLPWMK